MKRLLLVAVLAAAAGAGFFTFRRAAPAVVSRYNVLLVTIDTLRADRVGRDVTPAIDRLAGRGVRFVNARTTVPLTLPAHVSLMTGTSPPIHGVRDNGVAFAGGVPTLAQAFRKAGYRTGAFVGAFVLDRRFGLSDGFDTYDDRIRRDPKADARLEAERRGGEVVDAAITWLDAATEPFFLWVHLYDPHAPYDPLPEFRLPGASAYESEVRYADAQIARLLDRLRQRGLEEKTIAAVTGDHGEGLGEHGEQTHGLLTYDTTLRVPLVVVAPGLAPAEIRTPVSLADVAAALLRLAGITGVMAPRSGADLFSVKPDADVYAESHYAVAAGWHPLATLAGEQWKLVVSSENELFDLGADPGELHNVASERPAVVEGMSARLERIRSSVSSQPASSALSADAAERLRALGYVSGGVASHGVDSNAPNPARMTQPWSVFERALGQLTAGRAADAIPQLKQLSTGFPSGLVFQTSYARALQETGRPREAVVVLTSAIERWPADASLFHDLAVAARAAGDANGAMRAEQAALAIQTDSPAALNGLGLLHADAGRAGDAAAAFERAANADRSNASYWSNLGNAHRELGQRAAAEAAYRRALEADATHADAANGMGVLLVQNGKPKEAIRWFETALSASPDFHEARLNLGIAWQESGDREKAAAAYRELLAKAPARFTRERAAARKLLGGLH